MTEHLELRSSHFQQHNRFSTEDPWQGQRKQTFRQHMENLALLAVLLRRFDTAVSVARFKTSDQYVRHPATQITQLEVIITYIFPARKKAGVCGCVASVCGCARSPHARTWQHLIDIFILLIDGPRIAPSSQHDTQRS